MREHSAHREEQQQPLDQQSCGRQSQPLADQVFADDYYLHGLTSILRSAFELRISKATRKSASNGSQSGKIPLAAHHLAVPTVLEIA
jgi:hypothetical protein